MTMICGAVAPMTLEGNPFWVCTKSPNHRGRHSSTTEAVWAGSVILSANAVLLTLRYKATKGQIGRIVATLEQANKTSNAKTT